MATLKTYWDQGWMCWFRPHMATLNPHQQPFSLCLRCTTTNDNGHTALWCFNFGFATSVAVVHLLSIGSTVKEFIFLASFHAHEHTHGSICWYIYVDMYFKSICLCCKPFCYLLYIYIYHYVTSYAHTCTKWWHEPKLGDTWTQKCTWTCMCTHLMCPYICMCVYGWTFTWCVCLFVCLDVCVHVV